MLKLFNSDGRKMEIFRPMNKGRVGLYCCGPTVYSYAHIGNLRAFLSWDILRRVLGRFGYSVNHVMNITDVGHLSSDADDGEDKMLLGAKKHNMTVWEVAEHFAVAFWSDMEKLNILVPTTVCKATEHIDEMIALIRILEEKNLTYQVDGNVYFDTSVLKDYGRLTNLDKQSGEKRSRVGLDQSKRNDTDFVLWFTRSKFENHAMVWDSPWGRGYPGWHLECSAMSIKYLGKQFDIHAGGMDLVPVHHTNEIAQSEGAFGQKWVNYWLHNEFLVMREGKMSKSKGKMITLGTLVEEGFDPMDYRYFLLGGHYRSQLLFSSDSLESAASARRAINRRIASLREKGGEPSQQIEHSGVIARLKSFDAALADDLNTPRALAELWGLLKDEEIPPSERLSAIVSMDSVLGLRLDEEIEKVHSGETLDQELVALLDERQNARNNRDWVRADEIREEFTRRGWIITDTSDGQKISKK